MYIFFVVSFSKKGDKKIYKEPHMMYAHTHGTSVDSFFLKTLSLKKEKEKKNYEFEKNEFLPPEENTLQDPFTFWLNASSILSQERETDKKEEKKYFFLSWI